MALVRARLFLTPRGTCPPEFAAGQGLELSALRARACLELLGDVGLAGSVVVLLYHMT